MIIQPIFDALYSRYANDTPLPAHLEGLYYLRAPQNATGVYGVVSLISGRQEYDMSSRLEDMVVSIRLFSDDSEEAEGPTLVTALVDEWCAWFDDCTLTIGNGQLIRIDREAYNILPDPDGPGWMAHIDYHILAQEVS